MPLQRDLVEPGKNSFGDTAICCAHCHRQANFTKSVDNNGNLAYELMCPTPDPPRTLGSWPNEQQRAADIRKFLEGHEIRGYKESQH
jgi:hypothetical protein